MEKTDIEFIEEIKNGSLEFFEHLIKRYEQQVYRIVFQFVKNQDYSFDVMQNIFIKVYQNLNGFRGECQFKTWLIRIVYNESQNWIKRNKNILVMESIDSIPDKTENQENDFATKEMNVKLLQSMENLNKKYRMAVHLRYFEDYSIKDIADILNCSEGVVKNILYRSLRKLAKILKSNI